MSEVRGVGPRPAGHEDIMRDIKKILVPVDFSETSRHAIALACDVAQRYDAHITLLNVYQIPGFFYPDGFMPAGPDKLSELMASTDEALEVLKQSAMRALATGVATKAVEGVPFAEIVGEAEAGSYDLIVMGTHGRTGLRHALLGSVAENVIRRAQCPVLTVCSPKDEKTNAKASGTNHPSA